MNKLMLTCAMSLMLLSTSAMALTINVEPKKEESSRVAPPPPPPPPAPSITASLQNRSATVMTESMLNVIATIRRCIAVANAIVAKRNASLTSIATMVMSGCRLITVVTALTVLIARTRNVVSSLPLAALANAKIFIATTIVAWKSRTRSITISTVATKFAKNFSERLFAC